MRRPRHLSAEERALWDSVAKQAKPLRKAPRVTKTVVSADGAKLSAPLFAAAAKHKVPAKPSRPLDRPKLAPSLAPLERRERARLKRGQRDIDAWLDLHGMTQARAHRALLSFLQRVQEDGCRYVLIITGKGRTSSESAGRGVLRRLVPEWFGLTEFRLLVVSYEEAGIGHGGDGALYVRVRRA